MRAFVIAGLVAGIGGLLVGTSAVALAAEVAARPAEAPCAAATEVVVDGKTHTLVLCEAGRPAARYRVSLGRGGLDKRKEGDGKTPLGRYPLGAPRASPLYRTFIPVGYPTAAQAAAGATGRDVGIHGPRRGARWLGALARLTDWTRGCIAVATDPEIDAVAAWVRAHPGAAIRITG